MKFLALLGSVAAINRRSDLGVRFYPQVEADLESDPITSSLGFKEWNYDKDAGFPINYKVPNFGLDSDIASSMESLDWAQKVRGKKWVISKQDMANWKKSNTPVVYANAPLEREI